jgi:hypothetical protein
MKRKIIVLMIVMAVTGTVNAATEAEKQAAIDAGLAWLATQQAGDGRWDIGDDNEDAGATAAALLAFAEEGSTLSGGTYQAEVTAGLNYLMGRATTYGIGMQPAGDPDVDGDGLGVKFVPGGNHSRDIYVTGLALTAISTAAAPGDTVANGALAGQTYGAVIQDTVDYLAYGQNEDPGGYYANARGGWRYYANSASSQGSDNSTSQWPVVGLLYAQAAGATIPDFVDDELAIWADYIQNADGGSDYPVEHNWGSNVSRTGTLLLQQNFVGLGTGDADVVAALNYLNGQWLTTENSTWNGNFGHPYGMWAAYKGLEVTIGLDDTTTITNLHGDPGDVELAHGWNWWEDYCEWIVNTQYAAGNWAGYTSYWDSPLTTAWYINILAATEIPRIPVPGAFLLGSIGLAFACRKLQRRKEL